MLNSLRAAALYPLAFRCLKRGDFARAIDLLDRHLLRFPKHTYALCNRGVAYQNLVDHDRAFTDFSRCVELDPRLMIAYVNRGISSKAMGEYERAIVDFEAAIIRNPQYAAAHGELGVVRAIQHDYDRAILDLTTAVELDPKRCEYLTYRGYTQFHNGDYASAATDLRKAIGIGNDTYAVMFCFLSNAKLGANAAAQLQVDVKNLKSMAWPLPVASLFLGTLTPDVLLSAAPKSDDKAEAHFYIGQWHLLRDDKIAAVKALREAMRSCPANFIEQTGSIAELRRLGMSLAAAT
jgi:tetratricopeptide (TPR) repeat protein